MRPRIPDASTRISRDKIASRELFSTSMVITRPGDKFQHASPRRHLPREARSERTSVLSLSTFGKRAESKAKGDIVWDGFELYGEYVFKVVVVVVVVAAAISVSKGATFALHCFASEQKKR